MKHPNQVPGPSAPDQSATNAPGKSPARPYERINQPDDRKGHIPGGDRKRNDRTPKKQHR
jgi:hypothetical protein